MFYNRYKKISLIILSIAAGCVSQVGIAENNIGELPRNFDYSIKNDSSGKYSTILIKRCIPISRDTFDTPHAENLPSNVTLSKGQTTGEFQFGDQDPKADKHVKSNRLDCKFHFGHKLKHEGVVSIIAQPGYKVGAKTTQCTVSMSYKDADGKKGTVIIKCDDKD